jgi:Protein of unknown function (DUF3142)
MNTARFKNFRVLSGHPMAMVAALSLLLAALAWHFHARTPRVWAATEVPIAFWAWRNEAPAEEEVEQAARQTRARALFLRAGQIDYDDGTLRRIRAVTGKFPRFLELHLVYNGTRSLLKEFEQADEAALASSVAEAYRQDAARASEDGARVAGIQLDIDAPTRLLGRYAGVLRRLRASLPQGTKLSVTGLPSWMDSAGALERVLAEVDFWIPQCYGASIPDRLDQLMPISSPQAVAQTVARARRFNHPFYAGLAAYGYAILYGRDGAMIEVRGDLDPASVANDPNLELVERRPFETPEENTGTERAPVVSAWRYVYRARRDGVTDGLAMRQGDALMLDVPSAGSLRASAQAVREQAGEKLLGICIFRLPGRNDPASLRAEEVAAALNDTETVAAADVRAERIVPNAPDDQDGAHTMRLTVVNSGTARSLMSDDALVIDLHVPAGSARAISAEGFGAVETLCARARANVANDQAALLPCAERRANVLRLKARAWAGGYRAKALLSFQGEPPRTLMANITAQMDDGRVWRSLQQVVIHPR